jgi:hypothetical protein
MAATGHRAVRNVAIRRCNPLGPQHGRYRKRTYGAEWIASLSSLLLFWHQPRRDAEPYTFGIASSGSKSRTTARSAPRCGPPGSTWTTAPCSQSPGSTPSSPTTTRMAVPLPGRRALHAGLVRQRVPDPQVRQQALHQLRRRPPAIPGLGIDRERRPAAWRLDPARRPADLGAGHRRNRAPDPLPRNGMTQQLP